MRWLMPLLPFLTVGCLCGYGPGSGLEATDPGGCGGPAHLLISPKDAGADGAPDAGSDAGGLGSTDGGSDAGSLGGPDGGQAGCTVDNCAKMIDCEVLPAGYPAAACHFVAPTPPGFNFASYCVASCNARPGDGVLVQCVADLAVECVQALDAGSLTTTSVIAGCLGSSPLPQQVCDDGCRADQKACDDRCSGGKACSTCRLTGMPDCSSSCPDAGFKDCMDCSSTCGLTYIACSDACPRQ